MLTQQARDLAQEIFKAGVAAADPFDCVTPHLKNGLTDPAQIIAFGKAAVGMARAAKLKYPNTPLLVVTNYENATQLAGATVMAAGHPVPDANGQAAAKAVIAAVSAAEGPILALISGGGSALLPAPTGDIRLEDKAKVNEMLLGAGLDITQMNTVRQHLSDLKGGGLLRHSAPNSVTALILSDVIGDDTSVIASGPTTKPIGTKIDARRILENANLWTRLPENVRRHLEAPSLPVNLPDHQNILVGSNRQSVQRMQHFGADIRAIDAPVEGDVSAAARLICDACDAGVTVWGGETTVEINGDGRGGRNQELALRIAIEAHARGWQNWTCLQGGSDGRDGPTDAAGGLVDQGTLARILHAGGDPMALLANNDSYAALKHAGDLLMTGATGTNVADLGIMIRD